MATLQEDLVFVPEWRSIDALRKSVGHILDAMDDNDERREILQMVSSELVENAFKHSSRPDDPVSYRLELNEASAKVTVGNRWAAERRGDIEKLEQLVAWIESCEDPLVAYQTKMQEAFTSEEVNASGLGLVRIAYEGSCSLSCRVDQRAQCVQVSAALA